MGRFRRSLLAALLWSFWSGTFIATKQKYIPGYGLQETLCIGPVACAIGLCIEYERQAYLLVTDNTGYIQNATSQ